MPKFILVDHSIAGLGGHHYEYAARVLRAAEALGYQPVLATHRRFRAKTPPGWQVHKVFRVGFWPHTGRKKDRSRLRKIVADLRYRWQAFRVRVEYSRWQILWHFRQNPRDYLTQSELLLTGRRATLLLVGAAWLAVQIGRILGPIARALVPFRGYLTGVWHALRGAVQAAIIKPIRSIVRPDPWSQMARFRVRKARTFGKDCARLAQRVGLGDGDIVFIPSLEEVEMVGLGDYLATDHAARPASWHLLLRRELYFGINPDFTAHDEELRPRRQLFDHFLRKADGIPIHFYTDTDQLTQQHDRLGVARFTTLPIPVSAEFQAGATPRLPGDPLRAVYLGDARGEKGYDLLPQLVEDLYEDYVSRGRVRFTLQSNFNLPSGEGPSVVARAQLDAYPSSEVKLLRDPLDSDAYVAELLDGDFVFVLYDPANYHARSSGIFAEALVAGTPVVIPSGSWMHAEIADINYRYHESLARRLPVAKERSLTDLRWRFDGKPQSNAVVDGKLPLTGEVSRYCWLTVPRDAQYMLLTLQRQPIDFPGRFTLAHVEQLDKKGKSLLGSSYHVGGGRDHTGSFLVPLEKGVRRIWLGLRGDIPALRMTVSDLAVRFLQSNGKVPSSTVAAIYHDRKEVSARVEELIVHHAHYKESARSFAKEYAKFHNPSTLVEIVVDQATQGGEARA